MAIQVYRKMDPDALGAEGYQPKAPLCDRCGREATFENPVAVTFRKTWVQHDRTQPRRLIDSLCVKCREFIAKR